MRENYPQQIPAKINFELFMRLKRAKNEQSDHPLYGLSWRNILEMALRLLLKSLEVETLPSQDGGRFSSSSVYK